MTGGGLVQVESIVEWAFSNTFKATIGLENIFWELLLSGSLDRFLLYIVG